MGTFIYLWNFMDDGGVEKFWSMLEVGIKICNYRSADCQPRSWNPSTNVNDVHTLHQLYL
jgi:hypothetical protein